MQGECWKNPDYMVGDAHQRPARGYCRLSCGTCLPIDGMPGDIPLWTAVVNGSSTEDAWCLMPSMWQLSCSPVGLLWLALAPSTPAVHAMHMAAELLLCSVVVNSSSTEHACCLHPAHGS